MYADATAAGGGIQSDSTVAAEVVVWLKHRQNEGVRMNENPEQTVLRMLRRGRRPAILFHYTSAAGLLGILQAKGIWATAIRYLNDSSEYDYALRLLKEAIDARQEATNSKFIRALLVILDLRLSQEDNTETFVSSFTENPDQLSQWRAYCTPHGGYAIGFLSKRLIPSPGGCWMIPCLYKEEEQRRVAETVVDSVINSAEAKAREQERDDIYKDAYRQFGRLVHLLAPALKHPHFAEEQEWRLVIPGASMQGDPDFRVSRSMLVPYHLHSLALQGGGLPIAAVKVGPTPHEKLAVEATKSLLACNGLGTASVELSKIPYRAW
jgi:hypothetical protein